MPVLDSADELVCWVALVGAVSTAAVESGNDRERRPIRGALARGADPTS